MRLGVVAVVALSSMVGVPFWPGATVWENSAGIVLSRVPDNNAGAQREETASAKLLKAVTGVSVLDIERYRDWKGGPNSIWNNPCGTFCKAVFRVTWTPPWTPKSLD
jgi:hypothetical protein